MAAKPTIAVFGAGSWGTALAIQLARNDLRVNLWGHRIEHIERLVRERENSDYLMKFSIHSIVAKNLEFRWSRIREASIWPIPWRLQFTRPGGNKISNRPRQEKSMPMEASY